MRVHILLRAVFMRLFIFVDRGYQQALFCYYYPYYWLQEVMCSSSLTRILSKILALCVHSTQLHLSH